MKNKYSVLLQIRTTNSKGSIDSTWIAVSTAETLPTGVYPPTATAVQMSGRVVVLLTWRKPQRPNGAILFYEVRW